MQHPPEQPQIYLITPPAFEPAAFAERLARVLDAHPVACLRLALASQSEDAIARAADTCREIAHARDVAVVLCDHVLLAQRLGLDGVHLQGPARVVREARKTLGPDAIVGGFCGTSRHDGISAGEAGADYVAFGPVAGGLGTGGLAEPDLFAWWSEMVELPVVAEGALDVHSVARLTPVTDFFGVGEEIWQSGAPEDALGLLRAAMHPA